MQMPVSFDCSGMVTVLPKRTMTSFPLIIFLAGAPGDQLDTICDHVWTAIFDQQVNVIARHYVVKYRKPEPLFRVKNPAHVRPAVAAKFQ